MKTNRLIAVALALLGLCTLAAAQSETAAADTPSSARLYVLNSGEMSGFPKSFLQYGGQGPMGWTPAAFFVIRHPKGNVLIDTGINDREIAEPGSVWGGLVKYFGLKKTAEMSVEAQLAKAGLKTEDVKYVVLTHLHLDHSGNIAKFPKATFIIQNDELQQAWWPDKGFEAAYLHEDIKDTKRFNIMRLNGNLDLFGDRSIEVVRLSGHTPGSQIVVARLAKTGTVLFTGDAVYTKENLDKNLLPAPSGSWFAPAMLSGYQLMRHYRDSEGALLFYTHDGDEFKKYRQPPAYYE